MLFVYIAPNNSSRQNESQETENIDIFSTLLDEVAKGDIMFIGDLNARTGNLEETLISDFDLLEDTFPQANNSDMSVNTMEEN